MRRTLIALLLCLVAVPCFAASGLTPDIVGAGFGLDWISAPGLGQIQITPLQIQSAYTFQLSYNTTFLTAYRILAAPGNEDQPTAYVNEFSVLAAYDIARGFNVFAGPAMSVFGRDITGTPENLYGGTAGVSFPLEDNTRMLVGYRYLVADLNGDTNQGGLVFGPVFTL